MAVHTWNTLQQKKKKDFKAGNELQKEIQQLELSTNDVINIQTPKSHLKHSQVPYQSMTCLCQTSYEQRWTELTSNFLFWLDNNLAIIVYIYVPGVMYCFYIWNYPFALDCGFSPRSFTPKHVQCILIRKSQFGNDLNRSSDGNYAIT